MTKEYGIYIEVGITRQLQNNTGILLHPVGLEADPNITWENLAEGNNFDYDSSIYNFTTNILTSLKFHTDNYTPTIPINTNPNP